jgi:hypothetical protein
MTKSKDKGTAAESLVVKYLQSTYWPHAERRALSGGLDKGDITGTPGLVWEVKAAKTLCVPAWLRETETERINAKADYATLVIKPVGIGGTRVGEFYALMEVNLFNELASVALRSDKRQAYRFATTIRKAKLPDALVLMESWRAYYGSAYGWVEYPSFALMKLDQMCRLLCAAGYGTSI